MLNFDIMTYMKLYDAEKLRYASASLALIIGTFSVAACSSKQTSEPRPAAPSHAPDWQRELSQWIGEQSGIYDKDGNVVPLDER